MSDLDDLFKQLAEARAKDPVYQKDKKLQDTIKESVKSDLGGLFSQISAVKAVDPVAQKAKKIEKQVKESVKTDLGSLFAELSSLKKQKTELVEQNPELAEVAEEPVAEVIAEAIPLPTPIGVVPPEAQLPDIEKYIKAAHDQDSSVYMKEFKTVNGKIKFLEQWIAKIQNAGPGGGEVNFRYLDDVDQSTIMDGNFLTYNADTRKFEFREVVGGSGGVAQVQSDWTETNTASKAYIKHKPTLFSGSYNDLTDVPSFFAGSYNDLTDKPTLFSGAYSDLSGKPTLFSGNYTDLTNKPTLFSGSYTDLTDKPSIPSLTGYATETYVTTAITNLIGAAPAALDTLKEIADKLASDESVVSSLTTTVADKVSLSGSYANPSWITSLAGSKVTNAVLTTDTGTVTNAMLASGIANAKLVNSVVTVGTTQIALGTTATNLDGLNLVTSTSFAGALLGNASTATKLATARNINGVAFDGSSAITIKASTTNTLTIGTGLSGTTFDGSGAVTIANTGVLSVNGNTGAITGVVTTADTGTVTNTMLAGSIANAKLANSSININGTNISLGGSANVPAAAATLTGNTLNSTVVSSSLTSVGSLDGLTVNHSTSGYVLTISGAAAAAFGTQTWKFWTNGAVGGQGSRIEFPDGSYQYTAYTGNAVTVTNGVYLTDVGSVTNTMLDTGITNDKLVNSSITVNGTNISLGDTATITAAAATLTGTGLNSTVVNSNLQSVGQLNNLQVSGGASVTNNSATDHYTNWGTVGQIFDDGNFHIHAKTGNLWLNALGSGDINLGTQYNSGSGSNVVVGKDLISKTAYKARTNWNAPINTEITLDNYRYRVANSGGIFPQVLGNISGQTVNSSWVSVATCSGTSITQTGNTGALLPNNSWTNLYSNHGLDAPADMVVTTITDKAHGIVHRVTFIRNDDGSTTGYSIFAEKLW